MAEFVVDADIPVNVFLDVERFQAALIDINNRVSDATDIASVKAAKLLAKAVRAKLATFPHPHDPQAISPAPPFKGPVGMLTTGWGTNIIAGHLRDSVTVEAMPFIHGAKVYPTAVYARIQELGGWTGGSRTLYSHIGRTPTGFPQFIGPFKSGSHHTYLPPRPYFRPTVLEAGTVGGATFNRVYWEEWRDAMMRAVAF